MMGMLQSLRKYVLLRCMAITYGTHSKRQLDDEELDSGDDEGRDDRLADEAQAEQDQQETVGQDLAILEVELPRQAGPQPSDGEV